MKREYSVGIGSRLTRVSLISGVCVFMFIAGIWCFLTIENFPGHEELRMMLIKKLAKIEPFPVTLNTSDSHSDTALYVLGGWQGGLKNKFKVAADLYKNKMTQKIFVLSEPSMTEYGPELGRNLTNDEWAIKNLVALGVQEENVEPLSIKAGFFGTLAEARGVSEIVSRRGYRHLILVTSHSHTLRTWETFSKLLDGRDISLSIYASEEAVGLQTVFIEWLKLFIYNNILLANCINQKNSEIESTFT